MAKSTKLKTIKKPKRKTLTSFAVYSKKQPRIVPLIREVLSTTSTRNINNKNNKVKTNVRQNDIIINNNTKYNSNDINNTKNINRNNISDSINELQKIISDLSNDSLVNNTNTDIIINKPITPNITNKENINKIMHRKKTPYSTKVKPTIMTNDVTSSNSDSGNTNEEVSKANSATSNKDERNKNPQETNGQVESLNNILQTTIPSFNEQTTLKHLNDLFIGLENENLMLKKELTKKDAEIKEILLLQKEKPIKDNSNNINNSNKILSEYFGLTIEPLTCDTSDNNKYNSSEGKVFTFKVENKIFKFSLQTDKDNSEYYYYQFIESQNLLVSEYLKHKNGITFSKKIVVRFFNEVFLILSKA
ncbi:hypothetical protein CDIK_3021 [Cucumispora dikerogammari]|nr:hypothetical protein CDIK_3021 [Cucumispora dikerogammari]